jgi:NitT/TauT family transport system substrate-binding protein
LGNPHYVINIQQEEDIQKVCRAVVKAVDYWKAHPEEANAIMAKAIGGWLKDPQLFAETLTGIAYYDKAMNQEAFEKKVPRMMADRIKVWQDLGKLPWDAQPADMYDASFVKGLE